MKVKELTVEQFKILIQEATEEKLEEVIGDPDKKQKPENSWRTNRQIMPGGIAYPCN